MRSQPSFKKLKLTHGKFALVSVEYFEMLSSVHWYYHKSSGYAYTKFNGKDIAMHHLILSPCKHFQIDHINRNRLDNRAENLRYATVAQNRANKSRQRNNVTGHSGVFWYKKIRRWVAGIGKPRIHLGTYKTKRAAISVYEKARMERTGL